MNIIKLKPCPKCGGVPVAKTSESGNQIWWQCCDCHWKPSNAEATITLYGSAIEIAANEWNRKVKK